MTGSNPYLTGTPSWFNAGKFANPNAQMQQAIREAQQGGANMGDIRTGAMQNYGVDGRAFDFAQQTMGVSQMPTSSAPRGNPYLDSMAQAMQNRVNQNLALNVMPGLRSQFIGAGGYGGSRQGIAEGVSAGMASQGLADSLASLYGGAYENDANRQQQESQFARNFGLQSNTAANNQTLGLYDRMLAGAGLGIDAANAIQNQPLNYYLQFMNAANAAGGQGGAASQQMPGNPLLGAIGGWQLASGLFGGPRP